MADASLSDLDHTNKQVIMFGGKGGVGKTTTAAATALHFSSLGKRTLIISSDPTPSLSDIFEMRIGGKEKPVTGNLHAIEISSEEVIKRWKRKFGDEVYEALSSFVPVEYEITDYLAGAPGIEEEFMLDYIMGLAEGNEYDIIVWDTAPAGHTLRLLGLPVAFIGHLEAAVKVYTSLHGYMGKLRETIGLKKTKRSPLDIISGWKALAEDIVAFIKDANKTEFIAVTIPEALGVYQTERLLMEFDGYGLNVGHMIINNVVEEPDCEFHKIRMKMQREYIQMLENKYGKK